MIYFDLLINFIESFMFSYFLGNYFEVGRKRIYIIITTLIQLLFLTMGNIFNFHRPSDTLALL